MTYYNISAGKRLLAVLPERCKEAVLNEIKDLDGDLLVSVQVLLEEGSEEILEAYTWAPILLSDYQTGGYTEVYHEVQEIRTILSSAG